ncbi:MAG: hypothetical protein HKN37_10020 [Rhodothermales bacterium]|nr:hypothetical protein [Rhodothermales bacterium]
MSAVSPYDHVLRTLAAVPLPEQVLLFGECDEPLASQISALGFDIECTDWWDNDSSTSGLEPEHFGWIIATAAERSLLWWESALERVRPLLRSGGWVIVCATDVPDPASWHDDDSVARRGFDSSGFALAEELVSVQENCHVIVRRVDPGIDG